MELPSSSPLQGSWLAGQGHNHRASTLPLFHPLGSAARCQQSLEMPCGGRISLSLLFVNPGGDKGARAEKWFAEDTSYRQAFVPGAIGLSKDACVGRHASSRRGVHSRLHVPQLPGSSFARATQSSASSGMACCPRKRLSWAACSCT